MGAVIGIDLGTTNSCAAIVKDGKPVVISDTGGAFTIPSIVAVDDRGNRLVGQAAKRQAMINPVNTIYGAKRLIGRRYHSKTMDNIQKAFTYEMAEGNNEDVLIKLSGEIYGLDEVSALILDKVRNTAQDLLEEEITAAVVTVPAYFNDRQRQAVKDAGQIAQLDVLRIINEPTAAALAYGWGKHMHELVAIYDLGGGTFDLSILEVRDNVYEVKATGGDTFLGGVDFDNRLMGYIIEQFKEANPDVAVEADPISLQRVRDAAERAKMDLSTKTEARILIPYIAVGDDGPINLDVSVTRDNFESLVEDLADRTLETIDRVLKDANLTKDRIEEVLLVGGSTRMPYIQRRVEEYFGKQPSKNVHPDEAVAIGAAIMAYSLSGAADYRITLIDVLPMSIGVALAKNKYHRIFERNATIPNATNMVFTTSKDNQEQLKLRIYQGDNDLASENELLGDFTFTGIRPAPKGQARLEVILRLSPEGILKVEAQDPDTKQFVETTINVTSGITQKTHKTSLIPPGEKPKKKKELTPPPPRDPTPPPKPKAATAPPKAPTPPSKPKMPPSPPPARPKASKAPTPPKPKAPTPPPPPKPPKPPPAPRAPTPPPQKPAPKKAPVAPTPPTPPTPPQSMSPAPKEIDPLAAIQGVATKTTQKGKVVVKRDPLTGQIIKEDKAAESQQEKPKQFKRYVAPPKPPGVGEKISGFFKNLFKK